MPLLAHTVVVLLLCAILIVFAYLDRIYRDLGRVTTGRLSKHLEIFASQVEPHLKVDRRRAALGFAILTHLMLAAASVETLRAVLAFVPSSGEAVAQLLVYLLVEVLFCVHFVPELLLARTSSQWLRSLAPLLRSSLIVTWPLRAVLELAISVAHISDEEVPAESQQQNLEALMEAAQEEGIIASDEAQLIGQVVEFSDKRVLELMTPRPDIVAIPAGATIEQMRRLLVETKFSRVLVYQDTLDDVVGIAQARDLLQIPDNEAKTRTVREIARPAMFVPETKLGSELLREMQRLNQPIAIAVDEHGLVAGVVTVEDLVEEIVGEMGKDPGHLAPDVVRETDGTLTLRGSVSVGKLQELFGIEFSQASSEAARTIAGLLNTVAGHVPKPGERIDYEGLRFEVVEANQRKVLRLRVYPHAVPASA